MRNGVIKTLRYQNPSLDILSPDEKRVRGENKTRISEHYLIRKAQYKTRANKRNKFYILNLLTGLVTGAS